MHIIEHMRTILIIEDDPYVQRMYKRLFAHNTYNLIVASDGEQGILIAHDNEPDLIFLDIMLPKMNGLEVLTKLKELQKTKHIPVFMMTNLADEATMNTAMQLGAESYMVKANFSPQQVLKEVDERLQNIN